jgi:hypothetical protein
LGQDPYFDEALDEFKVDYEAYVSTELRATIEDDSNLNKIIQMALDDNGDKGE